MLGTSLAADIKAVFDSFPASAHAAAAGLALAYFNYVSGCQFGPDFGVITTPMRDAMAATLETSLGVPGLPLTHANAWAAAVTAFWSSPPPPCVALPGVANGCPGAGSLAAPIIAAISVPGISTATPANAIAAALITATATVTATITLPPPTVFPIS